MGQQQSFEERLHECICNNNMEYMKVFLSHPEFGKGSMNDTMFVNLVERRWNADTTMAFARHATDHQLALLVSSAIIHSSVIPLGPLFNLMKDPPATIRLEHLDELFLTACDHCDAEAVKAMLAAKCFDSTDGRPIVIVVRHEVNKVAPDEELVQLVLDAFPGHAYSVSFLLENCVPAAKNEATKKMLTSKLNNYLTNG